MNNIVKSLRDRYSHVHPLLFARSVERSNSPGELFDILDEMPQSLPLVWDEYTRRWVITDDVLQSRSSHDV